MLMTLEEEIEDRAKRKSAFFDKMKTVAESLNYEFVIDSAFSEPTVELRNGDIKIRSQIHTYGYDNKIEIWGSFPKLSDPIWASQHNHYSINVAESSTIKHIVSHINSRLLPKYLIELLRVKDENQKIQDWINRRELAIKELITACSGHSLSISNRVLDTHISFNGGEIKFNNVESDELTLKLSSLTIEQAKAVFNLLGFNGGTNENPNKE